ncbi:hypothetical protein [Allisonella histaminiformans]|uniref:hypothetical protein n=1 Tax=Allisonella histaminiformans TaxID=209880 RepID=UPI002E7A1F09|nr:hypothetical protein [Allisonella histaminiformans]
MIKEEGLWKIRIYFYRPRTVNPFGIRDGVKHVVLQREAEYFFCKKVKILKLHKGGACNTFPSLEYDSQS